ncbi:S1 family peptidase [Litoreibacter arenae]|nr:serine protease [Litoreibacter arenae]
MTRSIFYFWMAIVLCVGKLFAAQIEPTSIVYLECFDGAEKVTAGTGVIVSSEGHVLTAAHVAKENLTCKGARASQNPAPVRDLTPVGVASNGHDFAIVKFSRLGEETFEPVPLVANTTNMKGRAINIWGYPEGGAASPSVQTGTVLNSERDGDGMMQSLTITSAGMSGGPVLSNGHLVGLVAGAQFNAIGQVSNYALLAAEAFKTEVRRVRDDVRANRREDDLAEIEIDLLGEGTCNELLRGALSSRYPNFIPSLVSDKNKPSMSILSQEAEFWVTITTGPAQWFDCKEGNLRNSLYFPVGLVLRPVKDIAIADDAGNQVEWTMFKTEYGLMVLIDRQAVAPITADIGYVFALGNGVYKVCGPGDDKSCDPGENLKAKGNFGKWPYISGWDSYLRTTDPDALSAAYTEYLAFRENQDLVLADDPRIYHRRFKHRAPQALNDDPACAIQKAYLYEFHKRFDQDALHQNSAYGAPVDYSFCYLPPPEASVRTAGYRQIKVITESIAEQMFDKLWTVQVRTSPTELVKKLSGLLPDVNPLYTDIIRCGQNLRPARSPFDTANQQDPVAIGDLVTAELASDRIQPDQNLGYRFRLYQPSAGESRSQTLSKVPLFQDIDLEIFCGDDREPLRAQAVNIYFSPVFDSPLRLDMKAVENAFIENFNSIDHEGRIYVKDGYIERICNYLEYQGWLDTLKAALKKETALSFSMTRLGLDKEIVANHFAHLILATLFFTEVEMQTEDNHGGCPR